MFDKIHKIIQLPRFCRYLLIGIISLTTLFLVSHIVPTSPTLAHEAPPEGFSYLPYLSGLDLPVDMEFLPSGDIFIAEKGSGGDIEGIANIRLVRDGLLLEKPVIALHTNPFGDSGVQGIVLDPGFGSNNLFYVWYATSAGSKQWSGETVYRLSRFTFDPLTETADPESEHIILDGVPWGAIHNGGGLIFDPSGNLYIATGDKDTHDTPQDLTSLNGKILRITPGEQGYTIPADNPFVGQPNIRAEIYAYGLRNPFRMTLRDSDQGIYFNDVGNNSWEELNFLQPGANYGWPIREGPCPINTAMPCEPAPPGFTNPILYYPHPDLTGSAMTGIAFYTGNLYPQNYYDHFFFTDIDQQYIATADIDLAPIDESKITHFVHNAGFLVDLENHADDLYALEIYSGQILRLTYEGVENQTPVVGLDADIELGAPPMLVNFSGQADNVDGAPLEYRWDYGDGSSHTSSTPQASHTYQSNGNFTATLQVINLDNGRSGQDSLMITVYSGEIPQIELNNLTEPGRELYYGGDVIEYRAVRSTTADLNPDIPFSWQINLHHNLHYHPIIADNPTEVDTLEIPSDDHGGDWNLWYRFILTMNTNNGIKVSVSKDLLPGLIDISVSTQPYNPARTIVSLNQIEKTVPYTLTSIVNTDFHAHTPETILHEGGIYRFDYWQISYTGQVSDQRSFDFSAPEGDTTLTAYYAYAGEAPINWLPAIFFKRQIP